jgi:hypothetical protein
VLFALMLMPRPHVGLAWVRERPHKFKMRSSPVDVPVQRKILRLYPVCDIVVGEAMSKLMREPIRPYWWALLIVLAGLLLEMAAAIAAARPLKTIVDNVVSSHHLPMWLTDSVGPLPSVTSKVYLVAFAVLLLLAIPVASAIAHRMSTSRNTNGVVRINSRVVAEESTCAGLNEAQYETKATLAA